MVSGCSDDPNFQGHEADRHCVPEEQNMYLVDMIGSSADSSMYCGMDAKIF